MIQIPDYVQFVLNTLEANGFSAYIVGGSVRDAMRGKTPDDFDVTTDAEPNEICRVFDGVCRVILTGLQHGTVTVLSDAHPIEVTTFRTDGDYKDNRHPQNVAFVKSIDADLARRDFTVNAMAYAPKKGLVDLYGGKQDLESRVLRCVGTPSTRFHEDALRILRALRFASVLQFEIEEETARAIHNDRALLKNVSAERIRTELFKLLCGKDAEKILLTYPDVFFTLFPQLKAAKLPEIYTGVVQSIHTLEVNPVLRFTSLLLPIADAFDACCAVIESLKTDRKSADMMQFALRHAGDDLPTDTVSAKHALRQYNAEHLLFLAKLKNADDALLQIESVLKSGEPYCIRDLKIGGADIAALGYKGKEIGEVLNHLLTLVIDGKIENEKENLIDTAKRRDF